MNSDNYYKSKAHQFFEQTHNLDMSAICLKFINYLRPGSKILDAGCGSGRDSQYFINEGYQVYAFDSSEEMAALASKHIGQKVHVLEFSKMTFKEEFDGVWACASLLHLDSDSLVQTLSAVYSSLVGNGILYCSFKLGNFEGYRGDRYFKDLQELDLKVYLSNAGFSILDIWITGDVRISNDQLWLNALAKKLI